MKRNSKLSDVVFKDGSRLQISDVGFTYWNKADNGMVWILDASTIVDRRELSITTSKTPNGNYYFKRDGKGWGNDSIKYKLVELKKVKGG